MSSKSRPPRKGGSACIELVSTVPHSSVLGDRPLSFVKEAGPRGNVISISQLPISQKTQDNQLIKMKGFLLAYSFADPVHDQSFYCFETVIRQCVLVEETIHSFSSQEAPRSRIPIPSEGKL